MYLLHSEVSAPYISPVPFLWGVQNVSKNLSSVSINHTIITIIKGRNPYDRFTVGMIVPKSQKGSAILEDPARSESVLQTGIGLLDSVHGARALGLGLSQLSEQL